MTMCAYLCACVRVCLHIFMCMCMYTSTARVTVNLIYCLISKMKFNGFKWKLRKDLASNHCYNRNLMIQ